MGGQLFNGSWVGLCESSFLLLELFIGYSSTRLIPEVAVNYRMIRNSNRHIPGFSVVYSNGLK